MEDYPRTLLAFEKRFGDEKACRAYLAQLRWPDGFRCPRCGHDAAWITNRALYHCRACSLQTSVTAGTIFQDTRKPLLLWFRAMWHVVAQKNGVSALGIHRVLGFGSYRTAWTWLHKLRRAMVRPGRDRLSGTVEIDETYIGRSKSRAAGRGAEGKTLIVVAVEDKGGRCGRIRLCRVPDASAKSLSPAITGSVVPGSTLRTDGWTAYLHFAKKGYVHEIVPATSSGGEGTLPLADRVIALLKAWLRGTHQGAVRPSHLDYYLDEFTFRFNRRASRSRGKLFYRLVQQAVAIDPVTGADIAGEG